VLSKNETIKCPVCNGNAVLPKPIRNAPRRTIQKTIMAKLLRDAGYTMREIMEFLEYKSPRSVALCLKRSCD
jgi:murein L,D-transpeptidase YcbB/YkuD